MGRLTGDNIEQFRNFSNEGSSNRRKYLSLKDKGDTAVGRILCNKAEEIECYVVHRVKVGQDGWDREVNCLYEQGGTIADCPFCKAKMPRSAKIYIPFYDADSNEIKIFERPNSFYSKVSSYCSRFSPIVNYEVELVRNHEKDSKKPDYDIFPGKPDDTTIEDILDDCGVDELPKIMGTYVLDKTAEDMEYYLANGDFPSATTEVPIRRRGTDGEEAPRRRNRGGDRF